ncbi:PREDICTED: centromere protein N [Cercocebus atys]|uniref:centromere protein N n=1 Tax=Cercocebus atys TaxID=9531 RepID=UPI0005F3FE26|nr:PREDICTED: centromere protein N [Cercocebus atys]
MDETVAEFIKRTILKIPLNELTTILKAWDFLSENQLQTVNFRQRKESVVQHLIHLCEEKRASLNDAALLDIICKFYSVLLTQESQTALRHHTLDWGNFIVSCTEGIWKSWKLCLFFFFFFLNKVTVSFRETEENAVWIRIAWGTQYTKPNQYKPTYVVYYSQTPYAFKSSSTLRRNTPLLGQALTVASKHHQIVKMDLRSRYLDSLKAIVFKQYNQTFETHNSATPLQERSLGLDINMDSRITHENIVEKERVQRITQETFGDYPQPQLEFAQYKLETKFKSDLNGSILAEREEPLRCLIKFSSPHLLEALKSLAPAGIADAPLSPLLTCIPNKRKNYFKIRDK